MLPTCSSRSEYASQRGICQKLTSSALLVVGIALAVLGALTITGIFCPSTPLSFLGATLGPVGAGFSIAFGMLFCLGSFMAYRNLPPIREDDDVNFT